MKTLRIGIDLGGTKIEAIALDQAGGEVYRRRIPTPAGDYHGILNAIVELVADVERQLGQAGTLGIGTPGSISPRTGLIRNSNSLVLNGRPLDRDLAEALQRPVRLENDANCLALSEARDGAGRGAATVFSVILGTGVGGGLTVDGRLVSGRNRVAGEWGHNPLPWPTADEQPGPPCYCGKSGCLETFLSGPAMARLFAAATSRSLSPAQIAAAAAAGEGEAVRAMAQYESRLARGLAHVVNIVDPDVIVLAGGLSNIRRLYHSLPQLLTDYVFADGFTTPIVPARFGDSSGVRGAALLWSESGGDHLRSPR